MKIKSAQSSRPASPAKAGGQRKMRRIATLYFFEAATQRILRAGPLLSQGRQAGGYLFSWIDFVLMRRLCSLFSGQSCMGGRI